jgi:hypothetical protein
VCRKALDQADHPPHAFMTGAPQRQRLVETGPRRAEIDDYSRHVGISTFPHRPI